MTRTVCDLGSYFGRFNRFLVGVRMIALPELVKENAVRYRELSAVDKEQLIEEFGELRENKAVGVQATMRGKINDATHTLKAIETEVLVPYLMFGE